MNLTLLQQQIFAAFAASVAPLAGKTGILIADLIPATEALLETFQGLGKTNYTLDDLVNTMSVNNPALALLNQHIEAMPDA